jgi:tripartite-type tricarboxylate transporter receptor subunit TctC
MNRISRRRFSAALATLPVAAALPQAAFGQAWPGRPVRFIVPYPPGGGTDVIARIVQQRFSEILGQPIVIENRGGSGGVIGTDAAAKAASDGYTVLFTLNSHTINAAIFPRLPFDTERDFLPVGTVASLPQILAAHPGFAPNTVAEVIAEAKRRPGELHFASVGNGSPSHLAGELLNLRAGVKIVHVPYRGGGPAVADVMGGQVPLLWVSIPAAAAQVKAGRLKPLAVSTLKRSAAFPDVPTMQEAGVRDFEVDSWYAMFVPARTPRLIIDRLNTALNEVLKDADIREKLLQQGSEAVGGTPEALGSTVTAEIGKWTQLAREANIKVD